MFINSIKPNGLPINFKSAKVIKTIQNSDEYAINLLKKELSLTMPEQKADEWVKTVNGICKKLEIKPENLPISKEHPGNLSVEKSKKFFIEIFNSVFQN